MSKTYAMAVGRKNMSGYAKDLGIMAIFNGVEERDYTIGWPGDDTDIVMDLDYRIVKHPFDPPRESTEEERAAMGFTW